MLMKWPDGLDTIWVLLAGAQNAIRTYMQLQLFKLELLAKSSLSFTASASDKKPDDRLSEQPLYS
jgi:hypothetical protein